VEAGAGCSRVIPSRCDDADPPTYARDVRPILERRCAKCHAGDGEAAAEHNFSKVDTLRAQRADLSDQIGGCAMPPRSEGELPASEARVLLAWVACGAR
jgi:hypothetical protein